MTIIASPTSGIGIKARKDSHTRLPMPHIQVRKKAPQFHPSISGGTAAESPCPEVFSIAGSVLELGEFSCMMALLYLNK